MVGGDLFVEHRLLIDDLLTRCRFPDRGPRSMLDCALSGGPDSSALVALAAAAGYEVTAWHVDHGLRIDAEADAELARSVAERVGAGFELRRIVVETGPGLEARARHARYDVLPAQVCTGHTADDRAETVLMNIGRGGGLVGAAAPFERVHRPIIGLRRSETATLCEQLELPTADDPMNHDVEFTRVAIRRRVIPALADALGRDPVPLLNRHADLAADAAAVIATLASEVDPTDAKTIAALPRAVASEALRAWLIRELDAVGAPDAASIERVLDVAAGRCVATEIEGGHRVARTANRLRVEPTGRGNVSR